MKFEELESKPSYEQLQPEILHYCKENNIFERSLNERENEEIVFCDGPPFPTGKPLRGRVKDIHSSGIISSRNHSEKEEFDFKY